MFFSNVKAISILFTKHSKKTPNCNVIVTIHSFKYLLKNMFK